MIQFRANEIFGWVNSKYINLDKHSTNSPIVWFLEVDLDELYDLSNDYP